MWWITIIRMIVNILAVVILKLSCSITNHPTLISSCVWSCKEKPSSFHLVQNPKFCHHGASSPAHCIPRIKKKSNPIWGNAVDSKLKRTGRWDEKKLSAPYTNTSNLHSHLCDNHPPLFAKQLVFHSKGMLIKQRCVKMIWFFSKCKISFWWSHIRITSWITHIFGLDNRHRHDDFMSRA